MGANNKRDTKQKSKGRSAEKRKADGRKAEKLRDDQSSKKRKGKKRKDADLMEAALEDLERSGLSAKDYDRLQLEVMSADETDDYVGEHRSSYRIPYFDLKGKRISYSRVRFLEGKKGKFSGSTGSFRYSQPANSAPHAYFPPYLQWDKIAKDVTETILITEGEKKAAVAAKAGLACLALGGVYSFKSSKRLWDLIPELQDINWRGRRVEICFDADVMWKAEVRQALSMLAFTLTQEQGPEDISFVFLDAETAGPKTGLDDYIKANGVDAFMALERHSYMASEKVQILNARVSYVESQMRFFDIKVGKYYKNLYHVRESFLNLGEAAVDGKKTVPIVDLWAKSATRRSVRNIIYVPGGPELNDHNDLNIWQAPAITPKKGNPKMWLELVRHIMREGEWFSHFLKWLAYPIQHPGAKVFQAPFVYSQMQGTGKTFIVDPVMEFVYGPNNFYRLSNKGLNSNFNFYAAKRQFVVTNEIFIPDYSDRRNAMSMLKDIITRETVTINEKFQPEVEYMDVCNYYLTSNHGDAIVLEKNDRRFFVIEGPEEKLSTGTYKMLDEWLREAGGAANIMHYLLNSVDCSNFDPKGDAPMTKWKKQAIELARDPLAEFAERVIEDPDRIFMANGSKPDMQLFRAEDLLKTFEHTYPRHHYTVTVKRMANMLGDARLERRRVRLTEDSPLITLYAVFDRSQWKAARNRDWAHHYMGIAKQFAKYRRQKSH